MASSSPLMETAPAVQGQLSHDPAGAVEPPRMQHLANGVKLKTDHVEDVKVGVQGVLQNSSMKDECSQDSALDSVLQCDPVIKDKHVEIRAGSVKLEDDDDDDVDMESHCGDVNMSEANGLSALQCYSSSDSEPDSQRPVSDARQMRSVVRSSSSSSSSSSDSSDEDEEIGRIHMDEECSSYSEPESAPGNRPHNVNGVPDKTTGAVKKSKAQMNADPYANDIKELPPIPDITQLKIEEPLEFLHIGQVVNILDVLVSVESRPGIPAYDLGTVLFSDDEGAPLGFVDDVIGPVRCPIYIVRFVSREQIQARGIVVGQKIYAAPKSSLTKYVFLQQLLKLRGSDASWVDDLEVPSEFQDFSDDEQEQHAKPGSKKRAHGGGGAPGSNGVAGGGSGGGGGLKRHSSGSNSASTGSLERYRKFEQSMNMENDVNTRIHRIRDAIVTARRHRGGGAGGRPGGARGHARLITQSSAGPACFSPPAVAMAVGAAGLLSKEVAAAAAFNPAVPPPPLGALVPLPPRAFAPGASHFAAAAGHFAPGGLAWPAQPPLVMCGPPMGAGAAPPAPSPMPPPPTYGLFHNTSTTFRPMAAPMNPVRPPGVCSTFAGGGGTTGRGGPAPFALPAPRMGVPPYVRPARMAAAYPAAPAVGVLGSTNIGTGAPHAAAAPAAARYYSDGADVAASHLRFVYQSDMWLSNQSPPHQWPYSMPYLGMNLPPPPPSLQPLPPPRLLLPGPQPRPRPLQGPVTAAPAAADIPHAEQARLPTQH